MTICLIVQKDTLENGKVKSVLKIIDKNPEEYVSILQEGHCIPYQLIAHTNNDPVLFDQIISTVSSYKTDHGKDWYELDSEALSKVITLFLEKDKSILDFTKISSIFGFSFNLFPVVTKEIRITSKDKKELVTLIENLDKEDKRKKKSSKSKRDS